MRSESFWAYFETIRPHLDTRATNFASIFDYLDTFDHPVKIVETGCVRKAGDWLNDGGSTILFDKYAEFHPGSLVHTVDSDPEAVALCRALTSACVHIHTGDSVAFLKSIADTPGENLETIDLLYLDSQEVDYDNVFPSAFHHLQEYIAVSPLVRPDTLVVIDDAPPVFSGTFNSNQAFRMITRSKIGGNGKLLADYAHKIGAESIFIGQQCGWKNLKANTRALPQTSKYLRAAVTVSPFGIFAVGLEDEFVGKALRENGENGAFEVERAAKFLTPNDKVLIVGAHVGTIAIPLAKHCRHVTAVEANPWTFTLLKANVALNDAANVTPLNFAASDKEEVLKFVANKHNSGGSKRAPVVKDHTYFYDNPDLIDVQAHRLDDAIGEHNFALVLMDIEGSEYFALKGMQKILQGTRALIIEFIPHLLKNVAGVTPEAIAELLSPHFKHLHVFTLNEHVESDQFAVVLRRMYDKDQSDCGILFIK
jgi:FkbM family methyltransferase